MLVNSWSFPQKLIQTVENYAYKCYFSTINVYERCKPFPQSVINRGLICGKGVNNVWKMRDLVVILASTV